jgi:hypothetical protein
MGAQNRSWPNRAYLDALRPESGSEVTLALLATYSADPVSLVSALLALIARDEDETDGTRRDLADAVETLRGRVRLVLQQGRMARMHKTPLLTGVLDQFVREAPFDERRGSWHPKAALVKTTGPKGVEWRLWIGSRNLTAPENRDLGLVLVSSTSAGRVLPGAADIAGALARHAELPEVSVKALVRDVAKVRWRAPKGVLRMENLRISTGDGKAELPVLPSRVDSLTVVSPFLEAGFLRAVGRTECTAGPRVLLSTWRELERLAATATIFGSLKALDAPDYPSADPDSEVGDDPSDHQPQELEIVGQGLHAKLLHLRKGETRRIWMGSANATLRAWTGRNVEITAQMTINAEFEEGLLALLGEARIPKLLAKIDAEDSPGENDPLDTARVEVAAQWRGEIHWDQTGLRLVHQGETHPLNPAIALEVGLLTCDFLPWSRGEAVIDFGDVARDLQTELVQLRLTLDGQQRAWIQRAPAIPAFGVERDHAAFVRLMGVRGFLLWVASLLRDGGGGPDDQRWNDDTPPAPPSETGAARWEDALPTLEEMLASWGRDEAKFQRIDARVRAYLPAVMEQARTVDLKGQEQLESFQSLWETLRRGLGFAP